jgi:hypothetical protein
MRETVEFFIVKVFSNQYSFGHLWGYPEYSEWRKYIIPKQLKGIHPQ